MTAFAQIFDQLDRELWIVTARAGEHSSGLVATYVARVSLVPTLPRVTIALAKHHLTHELIERSGAFAMHLVGEDQLDWVWRFGIPSGREVDKFCSLTTTTGPSGSPILSAAPAWLDCRVEARMDTGDRTVYLAEVLEAGFSMPDAGGSRRKPAVGSSAGSADRRTASAESREQCTPAAPLTIKRLFELAPPDRLREMKQTLERDIELDRAAILAWRREQAGSGEHASE